MKISIVTITRNNSTGLSKTLRSVASQKDVDIEHIIVDGFSTDTTAEVLAKSNATIVSAPPKGVYNAINHGIKHATGNIIGLLHAGDTFHDENTLSDIARQFEAQNIDYLYGDIYYLNDKGVITRRYTGARSSVKQLMRGNMPPHPSLYMTRACADKVGEYAENYKICGDFDMYIRLFLDHALKGFYLNRDIVAMSTGGISSSLYNRLVTNPCERLAALRTNGLPANPLRMLSHYINILKNRL